VTAILDCLNVEFAAALPVDAFFRIDVYSSATCIGQVDHQGSAGGSLRPIAKSKTCGSERDYRTRSGRDTFLS
jgi:hypothetical protein